MMAPAIYEAARARACIHAQIWRPRIGTTPEHDSSLRIEGRVVRIFRDRQCALHWGQRISFFVPLIDEADSGPPVLSGTIYHSWENIGPFRFVEAFLESWQGEIQLVHSQVAAIRRPTLLPVCDASQKGFLCRGNL